MPQKMPWMTNRGRIETHADEKPANDQWQVLPSRTTQLQEEDREQETLPGVGGVLLHKGRWALTKLHSDGMVRKVWNAVVGQPSMQLQHSRLLLRDVEEQQAALLQSTEEEANSHIWAILAASITSTNKHSTTSSVEDSRTSRRGLQSSSSNAKRGRSEAATPAPVPSFTAATTSGGTPEPSFMGSLFPSMALADPALLPPGPPLSISRQRSLGGSPARSASPSHLEAESLVDAHLWERQRDGSPERIFAAENQQHYLVVTTKFANGGSLWDLMAPTRPRGHEQFQCAHMYPLLVPSVMLAVVRALNASYSAQVNSRNINAEGLHRGHHGGHGNIRLHNILLHSHYHPPVRDVAHAVSFEQQCEYEALNASRRLDEALSLAEIGSVCEFYLSDFAVHCTQPFAHNSQKINLRQRIFEEDSEIEHFPTFSRTAWEGRPPLTSEECEADDLWALASTCFSLATGAFIDRRANHALLLGRKWKFVDEIAKLSVPQRQQWEKVPMALREILKRLLDTSRAEAAEHGEDLHVWSLLNVGWLSDFGNEMDESHTNYLATHQAVAESEFGHADEVLDKDGLSPLIELQSQYIAECFSADVTRQTISLVEKRLPPAGSTVTAAAAEELRSAAKAGDKAALLAVLQKYHGDAAVADGCDSVGRTALFYAASRGFDQCVVQLLHYGADPRVGSQGSGADAPLAAAIQHGFLGCAELLLAHCPTGAKNSSSRVVNDIFEPDTKLHKRSMLVNLPTGQRGWLPLHYAVYHNTLGMVELCLRYGASTLLKDNSGGTPRDYSGRKVLSSTGDVFRLERMRDKINDILAAQEAAEIRAQKSITKQRKRRTARGEDLVAKPSVTAAAFLHDQKVRLMTRLATLRESMEIDKQRLKSIKLRELADVPVLPSTAERIRAAARENDIAALNQLFSYCRGRQGCDAAVNDPEPGFGMTACHYAARDNCIAALKFLLAEPLVRFHSKDLNGALPLHFAVINGHDESCRIILEHAKCAKHTGKAGSMSVAAMISCAYHPDRTLNMTPLHYAAEFNFCDVIEILMDYGADVSVRDGQGRKPRELAFTAEALKLFDRRAFREVETSVGSASARPPPPPAPPRPPPPVGHVSAAPPPPLSNAAHPPPPRPQQPPCRIETSSEEEKSDSQAPLQSDMAGKKDGMISLYMRRQRMVDEQRYITKSGAHPMVLNGHMVSELIRDAALHGHQDDLKSLLMRAQGHTGVALSSSVTRIDHGSSSGGHTVLCIDDEDTFGRTALILATIKGYCECMQMLIDLGDADVNATYNGGTSPLHVAALKGWPKAIKLLVSRGAKIDARDAQGNTALHLATAAMKKDSIAALFEGGCNRHIVNNAGKTAAQATKYTAATLAIESAAQRRGW